MCCPYSWVLMNAQMFVVTMKLYRCSPPPPKSKLYPPTADVLPSVTDTNLFPFSFCDLGIILSVLMSSCPLDRQMRCAVIFGFKPPSENPSFLSHHQFFPEDCCTNTWSTCCRGESDRDFKYGVNEDDWHCQATANTDMLIPYILAGESWAYLL